MYGDVGVPGGRGRARVAGGVEASCRRRPVVVLLGVLTSETSSWLWLALFIASRVNVCFEMGNHRHIIFDRITIEYTAKLRGKSSI